MKRGYILFLATLALSFHACTGDNKTEQTTGSATESVSQSNSETSNPADDHAGHDHAMDGSMNTDAASQPGTQNTIAGPTTAMKFDKMEHDFGTIAEGEKVKYSFSFKNTGQNDLLISNAQGSCGCTVADYPKEPLAPGATAFITAEFDSKGKTGDQTKTVTITANTEPNTTTLTIKAKVEKKS